MFPPAFIAAQKLLFHRQQVTSVHLVVGTLRKQHFRFRTVSLILRSKLR